MAVVILNFVLLFVYPMLSEIQLHAVTSPCQTLQTIVILEKYNVMLLTMQLNWESPASMINICIVFFLNIKDNGCTKRGIFIRKKQ